MSDSKRIQESKASSNKTVTPDPHRYKMDYPSMGTCIIINNENFQGAASVAKETFELLGYKVKVKTNQTAAQMRALLYNESQRESHSGSASFVCVMLTHGDEGNIYGTDGVVELKELTGMFKGDRCKSLEGKPKLFFIQACRGSGEYDGIEPDSHVETETEQEARIDQLTCRIPLEADFLYAYSTVEGYMQTLCEMLDLTDLPLMQMLTRVNGKEYASKRQMIVYMLTKELYFPPRV